MAEYSAERAHHPSVHHDEAALRHLEQAKERLAEAVDHHTRGQHATAHELRKRVRSHLGESVAHLDEASRLHERHEAQDAT
jgi:hypothetical protein